MERLLDKYNEGGKETSGAHTHHPEISSLVSETKNTVFDTINMILLFYFKNDRERENEETGILINCSGSKNIALKSFILTLRNEGKTLEEISSYMKENIDTCPLLKNTDLHTLIKNSGKMIIKIHG